MGFQTAVALNQGFGVVGEINFDGPTRGQTGVIKGTAADLVVGRYFTIDAADGLFQPGGTGAIGGILANPKAYASIGTSAGGPLAPTLTVPAGTVGEFLVMGEVTVALPAAAAIGAALKYNTTTGVIGVGAPGGGEAAIPNAKVVRYANVGAGLAVISLTN